MTPFTFSNNIYINGSYYFEITEEIVPCIMRKAYYINEFGFVFNTVLNRFEKPHLNDMNGYQTVYLKTMDGNGKACLVHRLVCFIFNYDPNFKDLSVNHKDGNKLNNHYTNLEWMTLAENTRHALVNNLMTVGEDCSWSKLTESQVHQICKILEEGLYNRLSDISKKFNCRIHVIRDIALGITWTHISKQYDINYNMRSKMSDREVEQICQIFCNNKDKSFLYNYYLVLFTLNWEETSQNRKRIYKLYNRDPKCFKYITDKFDY